MNDNISIQSSMSGSPLVKEMQVIPVAGQDSMLLNLSGAHAPFWSSSSCFAWNWPAA
ncbi:hypothetical protein SPACI_038210 [Sporomusa acidovorans DSM 3132]|uniref:Glucarate dehydratase n=1 Tax=Sporomusa acidovorans (strain ATCC 49682 / DSM 3132 / Mol) TaxID=1123286 RepID=A0ABZ3J5P9_SPOA4|nr:glucarate dehydratase [Sporomusa acidovorans DSM 3132]SDF77013.1 hypothetical protein SAMN04488499_10803 [Sporomusa acidovorans]